MRPCLKRIHVNQHNIRANAKNENQDLPVYTVKHKGKTIPCTSFETTGHLYSVYSPCKPLSCGAKVWLETYSPVEVYLIDGSNQVLV